MAQGRRRTWPRSSPTWGPRLRGGLHFALRTDTGHNLLACGCFTDSARRQCPVTFAQKAVTGHNLRTCGCPHGPGVHRLPLCATARDLEGNGSPDPPPRLKLRSSKGRPAPAQTGVGALRRFQTQLQPRHQCRTALVASTVRSQPSTSGATPPPPSPFEKQEEPSIAYLLLYAVSNASRRRHPDAEYFSFASSRRPARQPSGMARRRGRSNSPRLPRHCRRWARQQRAPGRVPPRSQRRLEGSRPHGAGLLISLRGAVRVALALVRLHKLLPLALDKDSYYLQ